MCTHMVSKQNRPLGARVQVAPVFSAIVFLSVLGFPTARAAYGQDASGSNSTVTLPAGTKIMVRMVDSVDSDNSQPQQRFRGALDANLSAGGRAIAPKGTTVFGRLLVAESANGNTGGRLEFDLTDIEINGRTHSLTTSSNTAEGQGGGSSRTGTKTGAAVGAVASGVGGAIRGAGAGAIADKVSAGNAQGEKVKIPAGTLVEFSLQKPVSLPVAGE